MTIVVWLTEGTWPACVDAARALPAGPVRLLHVVDAHSVEAIDGAHAGLLGRAAGAGGAELLGQAQAALLDAAAARLGRPADRVARRGDVEREVVATCADAGLLILARDGDRTRLGPKSLGRTTRFVLDHAPCPVLLVWPDAPPGLSTLPPPPPR